MPRFKLIIEYDGTPFVGWQMQDNGPSVQAALSVAIKGFCGQGVVPHGAGRTDAGVHALGQTAHIDLAEDWPADRVMGALNQHLKPEPIAVLSCEKVEDDFDARFSALKRHYLYKISNRRAPLTLERQRVWHVPQTLDAALMHQAAQILTGRHDFTTFRSVHCQARSPIKTIDTIEIARHGDTIEVRISARSFMHNQVRSMVGSLKQVGCGKWSRTELANALAARQRNACGPVAPAHGLYLHHVDYDRAD